MHWIFAIQQRKALSDTLREETSLRESDSGASSAGSQNETIRKLQAACTLGDCSMC